MSYYPDNPGLLAVFLLCNRREPNPVTCDGPLGKKPRGRDGGSGPKEKELVEHLQKMLFDLNYDLGEFSVNGKYGNAKDKAVKQLQGDNMGWEGNQLEHEGLVDPRTTDALNRSLVVYGTIGMLCQKKWNKIRFI